jgi:hypothetical protein
MEKKKREEKRGIRYKVKIVTELEQINFLIALKYNKKSRS